MNEFLKGLAICHHSDKKIYKDDVGPTYRSILRSEEADLCFTASLDYQFEYKRGGFINITRQGTQEQYEEIFKRRIPVGRDLLTVQAVKSAQRFSNPSNSLSLITLYFKGRMTVLK